MTTTVVLAEDDAVYRAGLVALLSARADLEVVGEAADGEEVLVLARRHRPDVVLMDLRMPRLDGVGATAFLTADPPDGRADRLTRVLVLTTFGDDDALYSSLRAGASGFLLKHSAPQYLVVAVREVARGNSWLDPAVAGRVIAGLATPRDVPADVVRLVQRLTPREVQVLRLMAPASPTPTSPTRSR